jgi:hypothetical protein
MAKALTGPAGPAVGLRVVAWLSVLDFGIFLLRSRYVEKSGKTSIGTSAKAGDEYVSLLKLFG